MASVSGDQMTVDGSMLEGGGQIIRVSMVLSVLLRKKLRLFNIRGKRSKPGLRPQHLAGLRLIRDLCSGQLTGDVVNSREIEFTPGAIRAGNFTANTGTAGSIVLLIQVSLPCLIFAGGESVVSFVGGTNAEMAPQIDYFTHVFKPIAAQMGVDFDCQIRKRGFFPKGGGIVDLVVRSCSAGHLKPCVLLDRGPLTKIDGISFTAGKLSLKDAQVMSQAACFRVQQAFPGIYTHLQTLKIPESEAIGTGSGIVLVSHSANGHLVAGSALGKVPLNAEKTGHDAADDLVKNLHHGGCVDDYMQDQLIIFMMLANGVSKLKTGPLTLHTETVVELARILANVQFKITESDSKEWAEIECTGLSYGC